MNQNLTKGEMWFRVLMGLLVVAALYLPLYSKWILWVVAAVLILTGLFRTCFLTKWIDNR